MENSRLSLELYPQKCFLRATYQVFNTNRMKPPAPMAKLRCLALKPSHYCLSLLPPSGLPCFSVNPVLLSSSQSFPASLHFPLNFRQSIGGCKDIYEARTKTSLFISLQISYRPLFSGRFSPSLLPFFGRTENAPFARRTDERRSGGGRGLLPYAMLAYGVAAAAVATRPRQAVFPGVRQASLGEGTKGRVGQ